MKRSTISAACAAAFVAIGFASAAFAQATIKIGVVTPLTGTYAGIGQQVKWGIDLAVKEINDKGGILGRKVEAMYEDEEANPNVAVQKAEKLFQVSKIDFLTVEMTYVSKELIDYLIKSVCSEFGRSIFTKEFQTQKTSQSSGPIKG